MNNLVGLLKSLFRRKKFEAEMNDELQFHIETRADDLQQWRHLSREEAIRQARIEFGSMDKFKEQARDESALPILDELSGDLRYAIRQLRKSPGFASMAILTFALGIGATTTMFGLVDRLILSPPPHVREPERVVTVNYARQYPIYENLLRNSKTLDVTAYTTRKLSLNFGNDVEEVAAQCVTHTYFPVLGTSPLTGRVFSPDEDVRGASGLVAIISDGFRRTHFGEGPALGKRIRIASHDFTVIGVVPSDFKGIEFEPADVWLLLAQVPQVCSFSGDDLLDANGSGGWLDTIGRLRPGVSLSQAEAEMAVFLSRRVNRANPGPQLNLIYTGLRSDSSAAAGRQEQREVTVWSMGAALLVLVIACANLGGLLSIRSVERGHEIALRKHLGASRSRIVRLLLTETGLLASLGGFAALALSWLSIPALQKFFPFGQLAVFNIRTLAAAAAVTILAALLSGLTPALQFSEASGAGALRGGHTSLSRRSRLRSALMILQVMVALALVTGAGLFVQSVQNLRKLSFGYDIDKLIAVSIDFKHGDFSIDQVQNLYSLLLDRVRHIDGVESAALSTAGVFGSGSGGSLFLPVFVPGYSDRRVPLVNGVSPDYFNTFGLPIVRGRPFAARDASEAVIIVDRGTAAKLWGNEDPIGKCVSLQPDGGCLVVVGEAESRRRDSIRRITDEYYVPIDYLMRTRKTVAPDSLFVQTYLPPAEIIATIAAQLQGVSPSLPYVSVRPLVDLTTTQTRSWRLGATIFTVFGAIAVTLAAIGIYGMLAFMVRHRIPEIGLRMAIGAIPRDIFFLMTRKALILVAIGRVAGIGASIGLRRAIQSLLFGVAASDHRTFFIASIVIAFVSLAACIAPALWATHIDPSTALRHD
jgi:putative ABC transport system permease protein